MQQRFNLDLEAEISLIHTLTQSPQWERFTHHLRLLPSADRVKSLRELTSDLPAIWLAALIEYGLTAHDISLAIQHWLQHNTDKFDIMCIVAAEPGEQFKKELKLKLSKKYPSSNIHYHTDPAVRGGFKLVFPHFMIDNSLARKFKRVLQQA
jgi:hypothetical protein